MRRAAVQYAFSCAVLVLLASCGSHHSSSNSTGPAPTGGTIVGTVTSSLGGSLAGVSIVVTPNGGTALAAVTTSASGAFVAASVPTTPDDRTLTLSSLPANCTAPTPTPHTTIPLPATWTSSNAPQLPFYLVFDPHPSNLPLNGSRVVRRRR